MSQDILQILEHNKDCYKQTCAFEMEMNEFGDLPNWEFFDDWMGAYVFEKKRSKIQRERIESSLPEEFS